MSGQPGFRLVQGSILDARALAAAFEHAEAVVHLAAGKIPRYGDALDTLVTNGEGGLLVMRAAHDAGVRRIVLASTSDCYSRLNVGDDREITIEALARMVWRLVRGDEPARIMLVPLATFGRYEDGDRRVPDNRRAGRVLAHTPQIALETGLVRTIAWPRQAMARAGLR